MKRRGLFRSAAVAATLTILAGGPAAAQIATAPRADQAAVLAVDPYWPQPLPSNWLIGQVSGISVDDQDRIWVIHRPGSLTADEAGAAQTPPRSICCVPAPAVVVFNRAGEVLTAWGGEGRGERWPTTEHSIFIDHLGFVWVGGNGDNDGFIVKYTPEGEFVLRIGSPGPSLGDADVTRLGRPGGLFVDPATNEVYVADGYDNHRVIVFDAVTGEHRRHWGAYGRRLDGLDASPPVPVPEGRSDSFGLPHMVRIDRDGLVNVVDRPNNRVQVFTKAGEFVREQVILPETRGVGSVWDIAFTIDPEQAFMIVADGENNQLHIVPRGGEHIAQSIGRRGRNAGHFHWLHSLGVDSAGAVYTGEVSTGKRLQKFTPSPSLPGASTAP